MRSPGAAPSPCSLRYRQSARDTLRNPARLSDTPVDLISMVAIADAAPTTQAAAVSQELMARVADELAKLDALVMHDVGGINRLAGEGAIDLVSG